MRGGTVMPRVHVLSGKPYDVYIGRWNPRHGLQKSKWSNPFKVGVDGDRAEVLARFEAYVRRQPHLMNALSELRGQVLACWCQPHERCHGDVLMELATVGAP